MHGELLWFNEQRQDGLIAADDGSRVVVLGSGFAPGQLPWAGAPARRWRSSSSTRTASRARSASRSSTPRRRGGRGCGRARSNTRERSAASGVERGEAPASSSTVSEHRTREPLERLELDPPVDGAPCTGDPAVDEERPDRLRDLRSEHTGPVALGSSCVRRACTSSVASHVGRKRTGASVSGSGSGARGRRGSSVPRSSRNRLGATRSSAARIAVTGSIAKTPRRRALAGPNPPR